ncbi:MAG: hypothetical protein EZS26_000274 [Candidatus Ordinivivax streblomastigis]|uniref:Uncharacterized protein n=1 Tax=Candidatus Ordinivivax streblomastigis TaxID=2540710 RepID=A0A5M8P5J7_9BACT|nr:MAG: hypothetical protein EZS26_000274 [Candidatus Ordinivivax streblomastigis]
MQKKKVFISGVQSEFAAERFVIRKKLSNDLELKTSLKQKHNSIPVNPLIAEPLYLARTIERMSTGTEEMIDKCKQASHPASRGTD